MKKGEKEQRGGGGGLEEEWASLSLSNIQQLYDLGHVTYAFQFPYLKNTGVSSAFFHGVVSKGDALRQERCPTSKGHSPGPEALHKGFQ